MKVVVAVKQVGALDDAADLMPDAALVPSQALRRAVNEWDLFALEAALELRDAHEAEVVAVTVGDHEADEALRTCLARGADRAVRVWNDEIEPEPLTVARLLAEVIARESPDLVLCGAQSSDAVNASTGTALAGLAELPRVAVVRRLRYDAAARTVELHRELESGLVERVSVSTPALLTLQTGINRPRHANLRAIKQAEAKPIELLGLRDLGLSAEDLAAASGAHVRRLAPPDRSGHAEMLEGRADEVAQKILAIVSSRVGS
jgi:electron transfer flavoprotein beta subunit